MYFYARNEISDCYRCASLTYLEFVERELDISQTLRGTPCKEPVWYNQFQYYIRRYEVQGVLIRLTSPTPRRKSQSAHAP